MNKHCIIILALVVLTKAQSMGNGISKYTRGQAEPRECLSFFENILLFTEAPDDCQPLGQCECATQGRSQLAVPHGPPPPPDLGFGVHAINCTYHPYGDKSLKDIEEMITAEVNYFKDGYNQHLDSHLGLWVTDLKEFIERLDEAGESYLRMSFEYSTTTYYSVMTQACGGYFIELISDVATDQDPSTFTLVLEPRLDFTDWAEPTYSPAVVKVSRATTKIEEMINFYTELLNGDVVSREHMTDDTEFAIVKLRHAQTVQIHFVNRAPSESSTFTVEDNENYVNDVHDEYIISNICGFDQHADHHWAYDQHDFQETLSTVAEKLDQGNHKYRWFDTMQMPQIYAVDPSGWTIQLDFQAGNDVPSPIPYYSAACKSDDGCDGQGICDIKDQITYLF